MNKANRAITVRLTDTELQVLKDYCAQEGRTQSDVLREFVRSLKKRPRLVSSLEPVRKERLQGLEVLED